MRIDARIYSYTQVLSYSLVFEVPVSSIPSAGTGDSIVGGHQGSGKEAGIPKRREERSRSGFGGRRPLKKSTVQVALRGRLQTCFTCLGPRLIRVPVDCMACDADDHGVWRAFFQGMPGRIVRRTGCF